MSEDVNAAVLSVKIACLSKQELNLGEMREWLWTDSRIVIG